MSLEDKVSEGKDFKEFGINPDLGYDREEFVGHAGQLFNLSDYIQELGKNPIDIDVSHNVAGIASNYAISERAKKIVQQMSQDPQLALSYSKENASVGSDKLARFVENNRKKILGDLSEKQLYELFLTMPLYRTGDKEHDRAIELREKIKQIREAQEKGGIESVVQEQVKELIENAPEGQRSYILKNSAKVIPVLTNAVVQDIYAKFSSLFRDKEGNLDREALVEYLTKNYKVAEDFMEDIPKSEEKEREDYWNDNLKPHYLAIAEKLYKPEKEAQKKKENPGKEARKEKARELGLAA